METLKKENTEKRKKLEDSKTPEIKATHKTNNKSKSNYETNIRKTLEQVDNYEKKVEKTDDDLDREAYVERLKSLKEKIANWKKMIEVHVKADQKFLSIEEERKTLKEKNDTLAKNINALAEKLKALKQAVNLLEEQEKEKDEADVDADADEQSAKPSAASASNRVSVPKKRKAKEMSNGDEDKPTPSSKKKATATASSTKVLDSWAVDVHNKHESVQWPVANLIDYDTRYFLRADPKNPHHIFDAKDEMEIFGVGYMIAFAGSELTHLLHQSKKYFYDLSRLSFAGCRGSPLLLKLLSNPLGAYNDRPEIAVTERTRSLEQSVVEALEGHLRTSRSKNGSERKGFEVKLEKLKERSGEEKDFAGEGRNFGGTNTSSVLWHNVNCILNELDRLGENVHNREMFDVWVSITVLSFLHPTETLYRPPLDFNEMIEKFISHQNAVPSTFLPEEGDEKVREKKWKDISDKQPMKLESNRLPFGRHLTSNELLLYFVRTVLETIYKKFVIPRSMYYLASKDTKPWAFMEAADEKKKANVAKALTLNAKLQTQDVDLGYETDDAENDIYSVGEVEDCVEDLIESRELSDAVLKRLQYERQYSDRTYYAKYALNEHRWHNMRAEDEKPLALAERMAWKAIREELLKTLHEKDDEKNTLAILQSPETYLFVNALFPIHY